MGMYTNAIEGLVPQSADSPFATTMRLTNGSHNKSVQSSTLCRVQPLPTARRIVGGAVRTAGIQNYVQQNAYRFLPPGGNSGCRC